MNPSDEDKALYLFSFNLKEKNFFCYFHLLFKKILNSSTIFTRQRLIMSSARYRTVSRRHNKIPQDKFSK